MTNRSFAEVLSAALDESGHSRSKAAILLSVNRSTLHRWLIEGVLPGAEYMQMLGELPALLGLAPAAAARYHAGLADALRLSSTARAQAAPQPIQRRLHYGSEVPAPFAGREEDLALLQQAIRDRRPVLITGMGGVGKTTLSQQLLRTAAADFAHGCDTLVISPNQTGEQVIRNLARLLGIELETSATDDAGLRALDELRGRLSGLEMLVLLDNVANVDQVRYLVRDLRMITWIMTARSLPLRRPDLVHLRLDLPSQDDAVAILQAHLRYVAVTDRADIAAALGIVERVGRLPLAISLSSGLVAGGQLDSLAELRQWLTAGGLGRRGQVGERLLVLFEQIVDRLSPQAREAFALCGVFPTPDITLSAYQAIGRAAALASSTPDLEALAELSLVDLSNPGRVRLHVLVHEYAQQRLSTAAEQAAICEGFRQHYVELAWSIKQRDESAELHYATLLPEEAAMLRVAEMLHAAADWPRLKQLWPLLSGYLWTSGNYQDYARLDRLCLDGARAAGDNGWAAVLLSELGYVEKEAGHLVAAEAYYHESQRIHDAIPDDTIAQARLRRYRSEIVLEQGDVGRALALLDEAEGLLARYVDEDPPTDQGQLARVLLHSAQMTAHAHGGDWPAAAAAGLQADAIFRRLPPTQHERRHADFRLELGDVLVRLDRRDEAAALWQELLDSRGALPHLAVHEQAAERLALLRGN